MKLCYLDTRSLNFRRIWLLLISLLLTSFITLLTSYYWYNINRYSSSFSNRQGGSGAIIKSRALPFCNEGNSILQRLQKTEESAVPIVDLLTDGEDPYQTDNQRDCRLHHYDYQDVVKCFDQLQLPQQNIKPLHFVFIGDSTMREQCDSFLQVSSYNYFYNN